MELLIPSYVFATPFFGGQAAVSLVGLYGVNDTSLNATATVTPSPLTKSVNLEQTTSGFGDLIPMFTDRWNAGVNNYMVI